MLLFLVVLLGSIAQAVLMRIFATMVLTLLAGKSP